MPRTDAMFEDDGFYCLKVTYDLKNAVDRREFYYVMSSTWACDYSDLSRAVEHYDDRYVVVTTRLARRRIYSS